MHIRRLPVVLGLIALSAGCSDAPLAARAPVIANATVALNELNALSAYFEFEVTGADAARIVFRPAISGELDSTPLFAVRDARPRLAALALLPDTDYVAVIKAARLGVFSVSDTLRFRTNPLPARLRTVSLSTTGTPPSGFILLNPIAVTPDSTGYAIAFDGTGRIRWYRAFPGGPLAIEVKQQRNGNFTAGVGPIPLVAHRSRYYEFTPAGQIVREYAATPPYLLDLHELLLTNTESTNPTAHFFEFDFRDTSSVRLAATRLVRRTADGQTLFSWNAWDHFTPADAIEPNSRGDESFDHPNSIEIDRQGNYVVSWRNFGEVTAIHSTTGAILWRLGGAHNEFTFVGDPLNGFSAQHSARILENGNLLLYDNGSRHATRESRAIEYRLDLAAKTATLVWQYRHAPVIYAPFVGSVQRYANGNTLIGHGFAGKLIEATPARQAVWQATAMSDGASMLFYRALRIPSLYRYEVP